MINIDEFRKSLKIDKSNLDEEIVSQPALFFAVSEAYTQAAAMRDTMKEELATTDAELDAEIRAESEKSTESKIKGLIQTDPKHHAAFIGYNEAKLMADQLGALKEAFMQRGYMLRDIAQLAIANFFETDVVKETPSQAAITYNQRRERLKRVRDGA